MLQPNFLKKGSVVGILSTARKISLEEIKPAIDLLKSWELNVIIGKTIGTTDNQFSGTDTIRTLDFQQMIDNPNIDAIWCARGGYGTIRIIDQLNFRTFLRNPKWVIGFSDITVLHAHLHQIGVKSLHAPMPINIQKNTKNSLKSLKKTLFDIESSDFHSKTTYNKNGVGRGKLVGGNLSILYSLLGSKTSIDPSGKILFIEDFDEYAYHIDRMLQSLKRSGILSNLNGLIVGNFTRIHENMIPFGKTVEELILEIVKEYDYPVCFDYPAGHIDDNTALILGNEVELVVKNKETTLSII